MEASTLSNPQRRLSMVQPIQKSLSLPSYARASGEGIDHRLIFAALEQKERVRRKSKIFRDKEKTGSRQNYFCLPLSSKARCRETSLSSDTSCSSLEFQKPKASALKGKKNGPRSKDSEDNHETCEQPCSKIPPCAEPKTDPISSNLCKDPVKSCDSPDVLVDSGVTSSQLCSNVLDVPRAAIGSSDSLERTERSSRSSTDSLSRRGRLEAVKARVEAEREKKYADSSSDEDTSSISMKQNSDGTSHRTVRDVKSKSISRSERYTRRKSQDESAMRKVFRQKCSSSGNADCSDKDFTHSPTGFNCAEGCCGKLSPTALEYNTKSSLSSQLCISKEERPSANISSLNSQTKLNLKPPKEDPYCFDTPKQKESLNFTVTDIPDIKKLKILSEKSQNGLSPKGSNSTSEFKFLPQSSNDIESFGDSCLRDTKSRNSLSNTSLPLAPTPPPRSPKSMVFFNKAFQNLQNKNFLASSSNDWREMNNLVKRRTRCFSPDSTTSVLTDLRTVPDDKFPSANRNSSYLNKSFVERRNQQSLNPRRKTCSNFSGLDELSFNTTEPKESKLRKYMSDERVPVNPDIFCRFSNNSLLSNNFESSKYGTPLESKDKVTEWDDPLSTIPDFENKSNSLENKTKSNASSWIKWRCLPRRKAHCKCDNFSKTKFGCECRCKKVINDEAFGAKPFALIGKSVASNNIKSEVCTRQVPELLNHKYFRASRSEAFSRLCKSEANLVVLSDSKTNCSDGQMDDSIYHSNIGLPLEVHSKLEVCEDSKDISMDKKACVNESFNLDTAMEELESVYRSLKESSDSIFEAEGVNVLPNTIISKSHSHPLSESSVMMNHKNLYFKKKESLQDSLNEILRIADVTSKDECNQRKDSGSENLPDQKPASDIQVTSLSESLCIDELFENLTLQLDREQKLLRESKHKRNASEHLFNDKSYSELTQHVRNRIPIVVSREELNVTTPKPKNVEECESGGKVNLESEEKEPPIPKQRGSSRRKYKAVRSYSANLSYLMKSIDEATLSDTASSRAERTQSIALESQRPSILPHRINSNIRAGVLEGEPLQSNAKDELICKRQTGFQDNLPSRKRPNMLPLQNSGQIWEVRVSMDCPSSVLERDSKRQEYPRLHSALALSNSDAKTCTGHRLETQQTPVKTSSATPLDDVELEKLLNSLLSDVSRVASSVVSIKDGQGASQLPGRKETAHPAVVRQAVLPENVSVNGEFPSVKMNQHFSSQGQNSSNSTDLPYYLKGLENDCSKLDNDDHQNNNPKMPHFHQKCPEGGSIPPYNHVEENANVNFIKHPENFGKEDLSCLVDSKLAFNMTPEDRHATRNSNTRRHSVGGEDFLTQIACNDRTVNPDKRFQTLNHSSNSFQKSSNLRPAYGSLALSIPRPNPVEKKGIEFRYDKNQIQGCTESYICNTQSIDDQDKSSLNGEKARDKSFKRKSSLNRLDFIHISPPIPRKELHLQQNTQSKMECSSSDDCGILKDTVCSSIPISSVKKKNQSPTASSNKDSLEKCENECISRKDVRKENIKTKLPEFWKAHHSSSKMKTSRIPFIQKKWYSAGEQDSLTDHNYNSSCVNHCLSAQEVSEKEKQLHHHYPKIRSKATGLRCPENVILQPTHHYIKDHKNMEQSSFLSSDVTSCNFIVANASCDTTSQIHEATADSCNKACYRSEIVRNCNIVHRTEVELVIGKKKLYESFGEMSVNSVYTKKEWTDKSDTKDSSEDVHFDNDDSYLIDELEVQNNFPNEENEQHENNRYTAYHNDQDSVDSVNDISQLKISSNCSDHDLPIGMMLDVANCKDDENNDHLVSEKEEIRHPSSILKKGYQDEKKELHGILKHTGDEKLAKQRPSILKHRDNSDEKDSFQTSDLHSILKKSTSEDESTNSSNPDIRPILKNSSTDDESSAGSMKPKPILKKRTSFNDEFSYACFLSSELKPILKKKTILEFSEEQPKPILKIRRKSEEAGSTSAKIIAGTRPRANSADLTIKPILKK